LKKVSSKKEKEFIKERYRSAEWIIRSISERDKTLYAVASSIFRFQKSFLEFVEDFLKPLTLKDVADDIEKHQSTISRLTNGKYAETPHGVYELKYFFVKRVNENAPATNKHLESRMLELVETEDKKHPLSDEDVSNLLKREGISVARRTITKYREKLKIPSARERKRRYEFY
jgi:RNA polymerase sigma-54 factor